MAIRKIFRPRDHISDKRRYIDKVDEYLPGKAMEKENEILSGLD